MSAKHTPAPWTNTGKEIRHAETSLILATVYNHRPSNQPADEAEANARLIATAPDLLEALENAANALSGAQGQWEGVDATYAPEWTHELKNAEIEARAAIAKAKGES